MSGTFDNHTIHVVEPGFNAVGVRNDVQAITEDVSMARFDANTKKVLKSDKTFTLVLGKGFEQNDGELSVLGQCKALNSIEQLRFLKNHGLERIVMARLHGVLVQNARAVGIEVIIGGQ
jgi:hypothetical protein